MAIKSHGVKGRDPDQEGIVGDTFRRAVEVLRQNSMKEGIKAAATVYNQVWSRDSAITLLGANLLGDPLLLEGAKNALMTLGRAQSGLGMIPANYDLDLKRPRWYFAGSTDAASWYIIALASLYSVTQDRDLLKEPMDHALKAYVWLRHQDSNNMILIDSQPGSDWVDNSIGRQGKTLYNNALFLIATKCINQLGEISGKSLAQEYRLDYAVHKARFNELFAPEEKAIRSGAWPNLTDYDMDYLTDGPGGRLPFYPQFFTFNHVDMHFDTFSHMLCILADISTPEMSKSIMSYVDSNRLASPYPIRVMDPAYRRADRYYDYEYTKLKPEHWRNMPYSYHNAGIWPFVGGFYVAALSKMGSPNYQDELKNLARANAVVRKDGEKGFNEWLDGRTGVAKGQDAQSWSAGMYVAAVLAGEGKDLFKFLRD